MTLIYRACFSCVPDGPEAWTWAETWWQSVAGASPNLTDGLAVSGPWTIMRGGVVSTEGSLTEVLVRNDSTHVVTTLLDWRGEQGRTVVVEEEIIGIASVNRQVRTPSDLVKSIARDLLASRAAFVSAGEVLLVDEGGRHHHLRPYLVERVSGLVTLRNATVAFAVGQTGASLGDGAAVLIPNGGGKPLSFSSVLVRLRPDSVARRLQQEAVKELQLLELPTGLRDAQRQLGRRVRGADEWEEIAESYLAECVEFRKSLDIALLEQDQALTELDDAQRRLRFLERQYRERGEVVPDEDQEELPLTVSSSVEAMQLAVTSLHGLSVSPGALDRADELDAQHSVAITAKRAWRALRALNDYVDAKNNEGFRGTFHTYCQETPAGRYGFPPDDVALSESQGCLDYGPTRAARVFPMLSPGQADVLVLMDAHIKVAGVGHAAARLHFYDDTNGTSRKVHVGYLGPHLPLP